MRVLTFNSHQPYVHLLASLLPWEFGVVLPRLPSGEARPWDERIRPLPANLSLYPSVQAALDGSCWDWVLAHNVHDLLDSRAIPLPKVFLVHGTLSGRILQDRSTIDRTSYISHLQVLLEAGRCRVVYISELKREDWGLPGMVIRPAIDPSQYGGYRGTQRGILQVCNHLRERGALLGWDAHQTVCRGQLHLVLGNNPHIPGSRVAEGWSDLKEQYRSFRAYLYTAVYPYEDGYNLALLEAMATGMPVASVQHPTSPIEDGIDGVVAATPAELRESTLRLLNNPQEAARLGRAAREKVQREFPVSRFRSDWGELASGL